MKRVEATLRGIRCLATVNRLANCTVAACAREVGLPRTTTHRVLETLRADGYLTRGDDQRYRVAAKAKSLGSYYEDAGWIAEVAGPELYALSREVIWPLGLITPRGLSVEVRLWVESRPTAIVRWGPGSEQPLHRFSGGLLYLAELPSWQRRDMLDALRSMWADEPGDIWTSVERRLAEIERLGYAMNRTSDTESGLAVPIRRGGGFVAAIGMQWITRSMRREEAATRYLPLFTAMARRIEAGLAARRLPV